MENMETLVQRLEKAVSRLETLESGRNAVDGSDEVAPFVEVFDEMLTGTIARYYKLSKEIGGDIGEHADLVDEAVKIERAFLVTASRCQQPPMNELTQLLQPLSNKILQIQDFREKKRASKQFNHLSAISESIPGLGWLAIAPKPGPYVKEMTDAAMFYTNRVLKEYKDTDKRHVEWVKAYINFWTELQAYIKAHHTTGLSWSKTGPKPTASPVSVTPSGGTAPPPPGPPPPPQEATPLVDTTSSRAALFDELNKGAEITSKLKHVPDSSKTHKNPTLRNTNAPAHTGPKPFKAAAASPKQPAKSEPPMLQLEGKKWRVENHDNANNLVIEDTELKQVAYVYKCTQSTLNIKGKINSITIDNCKKLGLVFDHVVGIVEVINSRDVKIQVLGKVPTVSINKTDGCHVYLSKDSLNCEIVSAKSSEMNVLIPVNDDFVEHPIPEQFKTVWNGEKLMTTEAEISG
ncbi:adenylyl cyclase-associated protein 1 [Rhincodon typus]|uniref:adenylyl cyclase-associated protein 1 n=1 Tax=Rhincodon typus TaxID=259920 RepID=UPI0009A28E1A|nr:adenylyl cyclase-associated protein 1 [Rhincodon typus]XP_048468804.1 adenylyl cyclase-associated protein 1 [Rhincodon typus]XP_048468805.1 adenylyl cyclase-associated protein 1 [Rhincodon typus]XP_048468806.1 adenylyl cyclase-associated protein 1 [Rhincodon typus]XP_048468807.1 adenylyl cyclase-associated protein 1 [Rhincodon typus]